MKMNKKDNIDVGEEMIEKKCLSAYPFWASAAVIVLSALFFPMYKISHYVLIIILALAAWTVVYKLKGHYTVLVPAPKKRFASQGEAGEIANQILDTRDELARLESAAIGDMKNNVISIRKTLLKIAESVAKDENDAKNSRRLVNYYLPTVLKLSEKYLLLAGGGEGANVKTTLDEIEGAFVSIEDMLKKTLERLYENDALDISTDIDVLNAMINKDNTIK